jgi:hypothetical protein
MGAPDASGRDKVEVTSSSAQYNLRADQGLHPHTSKNQQVGFQHKEFGVGYGEAPSVSVNPPAAATGTSKYIHPFMMERFIDDDDNPRLRIYSGNLYTSINVIKTEIQDDYTTTGAQRDRFITIHSQKEIAGLESHVVLDPTGGVFEALKDEDGKDTAHKAYDFPASQTYGKFYVQWQTTISDTVAANITVTNVILYRFGGLGSPSDTNIGELVQKDGAGGPEAAGTDPDMDTFERVSMTGTYHVLLGESFDPDDEDTNAKTIEQVVHENVYWQPLILGPCS